MGWILLFSVVFVTVGSAVGYGIAALIGPAVSNYTWLLGGHGMMGRGDLDPRVVANLSWAITCHVGAICGGLLAALSARRLGWWGPAMAAGIVGYVALLHWGFALQAMETFSRIPEEEAMRRLLYRGIPGAMGLSALSTTLAILTAIASTSLGVLMNASRST